MKNLRTLNSKGKSLEVLERKNLFQKYNAKIIKPKTIKKYFFIKFFIFDL